MSARFCLALALIALPAAGHAASMDYCRPYARDLVQSMIKSMWTSAYWHCLNSDEDPALPTTWEDATRIVIPEPVAVPADTPPTDPGSVPATGKSKFAAHSPGWTAWCRKYYPRSFDPRRGTVIIKRHKRVPCPG